jgi:hypothetical protein
MNELSPTPKKPSKQQHAADMAGYIQAGEAKAREIGNRGPIRLDADGNLHPDILAAYWEHGFYVLQGVLDTAEVDELRADAHNMIDRAPVRKGANIDAKGRPALGRDFAREPYTMIKPLSDPWGGTDLLNGRHQSKMVEPAADKDAPEAVVFLMYGMCQAMPAALRLYGHPDLLTVAEGINGSDFVPYNDAIFVKQPGVGGSVAWHQDGVTHWNSPDWDMGIHGFNFQAQLYPSTPANCLWVMPGTHKEGRINIKERVAANGGDDKLPGAVPLICEAGDVTIANRQILHASFPNTSADIRISITFGFHRRRSVLGAKAGLSMAKTQRVYTEQNIFDRASVLPVAIDARHQHRPGEARYNYEPFAGQEDAFRFNDETFENVIRDYNTRDLAI